MTLFETAGAGKTYPRLVIRKSLLPERKHPKHRWELHYLEHPTHLVYSGTVVYVFREHHHAVELACKLIPMKPKLRRFTIRLYQQDYWWMWNGNVWNEPEDDD